MEISQLQYFRTVAKHGSFSKAAEEIHITQSALSRSVAQLEEDIGLRLFERKKGGKLTLNRNGKFFLIHVVQILNSLENSVHAVREMSELERGVVNIAVSETVFLKNVVYDFLVEHPMVRLNCRLQSREQMLSEFDDGNLNFAVCRSPVARAELNWQPMYRDHMTVMLPSSHPFAGRKYLYLHELSGERFIIPNIGFNMESLCTQMCRRAGFEPYIIYEGDGSDLAGLLVAARLGVMITPFSASYGVRALREDLEERGDVVIVPLIDDFTFSEIGTVMKAGQFQSDAALALYDRIRAYFSALPSLEPPYGTENMSRSPRISGKDGSGAEHNA